MMYITRGFEPTVVADGVLAPLLLSSEIAVTNMANRSCCSAA